jgi:RHS repeat-associated protein
VSRLVAATVDLGDGGNCPGDLTISNQTLTGLQTRESCAGLTAGPNVTVAGGADVTFRAAEKVVIRDGFEVRDTASFEAGTDPSLFGSGAGGGATTSRNYTYDRYGNLVNISGDGGRSIPVSATTNRLTQAAHDAAGNVVSLAGRTFKYDAAGMMWGQSRPKAGDPDGEEWLYFYTADDEKVWSYHGTGSDWTLRDLGGQVLRHYRHVGTNWSVERDYVYAEGRLLAGTKPGDTTYHYHRDHLGSPRLITNAAGVRQAYHVYYPYGEEATATDQDSETMKFTGHERVFAVEEGTNPAADDLDYMHARWCSPVTGRFMSFDPIGGNPWRPQSFNRYAYVLGNPMNYIDPYGLREDEGEEIYGPFGEAITVCTNAETGGECQAPDERTTDQASFSNFLFGAHAGGGARRSALDIGFPGMSVREYAAMAGDSGECDWSCQVMGGVVADSKQGVGAMEWYVTNVSLGWLFSGTGILTIRYPGILAANGTRVTGLTRHAVHRAIGNGAERVGTRPQAVLNALKNPKRIVDGVDDLGRPYQVFHGGEARVVVNPRTGRIVSMNPLSRAGAH